MDNDKKEKILDLIASLDPSLFFEIMSEHQQYTDQQIEEEQAKADKESAIMYLDDIINIPYEGTKRIFIEFGAVRDGANIYHKNLKPIHYGFYEFGDGGSSACIFAGDLAYNELVDIYRFYIDSNNGKVKGDRTMVITSFEYEGWNFNREELIFELKEAEDNIKNYAENNILPYKRLRKKDTYTELVVE